MNDFLGTFALGVMIAVGAAAFARSRGWNMALPLIAVGVVVGFAPVGPSAPPEPELVLLIVLAPLVFGEALGSSFLDLRRVSRPVLTLAIGLVFATALAVGAVAVAIVAMPLAMAFALGAVLAPTDAVAVSSVARRAGLPRRLVSILEGESLVNDGTGLTALKVALMAAAAGSVTFVEVGATFAINVISGVAVGAVCGWILARVLGRSRDLVASNALVLVAPFLIYVIAEELEGSGILAVVVAALTIAHSQHATPGLSGRLQSTIVWRHITFVLQALAFFLVGLELIDVIVRLDDRATGHLILLVVAVSGTLIITRGLFVVGMLGFVRARQESSPGRAFLSGSVVIAWAGARGPVSGLAAFSIPLVFPDGEAVPFRDLILAVTFCVIVVTLLLSLTLAPLARALGIASDDDAETMRRLDLMLARAALDRLGDVEAEAEAAGDPIPTAVSDRLRADLERRIAVVGGPGRGEDSAAHEAQADLLWSASRAIVRAEQEELLRLRDEEGLPDAIVRPLLRELDMRDQALGARPESP